MAEEDESLVVPIVAIAVLSIFIGFIVFQVSGALDDPSTHCAAHDDHLHGGDVHGDHVAVTVFEDNGTVKCTHTDDDEYYIQNYTGPHTEPQVEQQIDVKLG